MIKLTFCLRRQEHLTWEEFSRYWRDEHAPLVAARAEILGIRRYVQVHTLQHESLHAALQRRNGGAPEPFDGVAELWFDSLDDFSQPSNEAAARASLELLNDERNFIDLERSPMWVGDEFVVIPVDQSD